ncbi:MAG TPA: MBL fold metallo-hydrolase [Desulfobacterales bacterium]|nr:MBL fold metallo-hydrolase [Desulfobacterales bacterium]
MRFCVLGSGSKGNCTLVESCGCALLIDAGFSGIELERRLNSVGLKPEIIKAVLVTHEHRDHVSGVGVLSRKYKLPVFINAATLTAAGNIMGNLHAVVEFETGTSFSCAGFDVHPFAISHDTADPVGFTINDSHNLLGYCTDTGIISRLIARHLSACQGLVLECNHDLDMLRNGNYPLSLQQRIRSQSGHLANHDSLSFVKELRTGCLRHVVMAHLSESNNSPELVQQEIDALLKSLPRSDSHPPLNISIAGQHKAGPLISLP